MTRRPSIATKGELLVTAAQKRTRLYEVYQRLPAEDFSINAIIDVLHINFITAEDSRVAIEKESDWQLSVIVLGRQGEFLLRKGTGGYSTPAVADEIELTGFGTVEQLTNHPLLPIALKVLRRMYYLKPEVGWAEEVRQAVLNKPMQRKKVSITLNGSSMQFGDTFSVSQLEGGLGSELYFKISEGPWHDF